MYTRVSTILETLDYQKACILPLHWSSLFIRGRHWLISHSVQQPDNKTHTSSMEIFSENFDYKALTYLIFFVGTHWFQKCNFWKNSSAPFWGRRGRRGQTTSKPKTMKILNTKQIKTRWNPKFGLRDLENGLLTSRSSEGVQWIFPKNTFFKSGKSTEKNEL